MAGGGVPLRIVGIESGVLRFDSQNGLKRSAVFLELVVVKILVVGRGGGRGVKLKQRC